MFANMLRGGSITPCVLVFPLAAVPSSAVGGPKSPQPQQGLAVLSAVQTLWHKMDSALKR